MRSLPTITTDRLILRPCAESDAPAMQTLVSDIEIARNTASIPHPYPDGGAIEWIRMHESLEEAIFAIIKRDSEELIGTIGLILKPHEP